MIAWSRRAATVSAVISAALLAGCEGDRLQSMLHTKGPDAARIATLWWVMLGVYGAVTVVTFGLLAVGLLARRRDRSPVGARFVLVAGVVIPTLILLAMLVYTVWLTEALPQREAALTVRVTGHQWWWQVEYPELGIVDANEIHIPAGVTVRFELAAQDVIHSFWLPNLGGKMDMLPEHDNVLYLEAEEPGRYRGQCAEYCGTQHAWMALWVVAHEPAEFERWVASRREPPARPTEPTLVRGRDLFIGAGCGVCHRVEGVAGGLAGPDLTRIGSRLSLGAARVPNTREELHRWLADPNQVKPGVLMPATPLPAEDLSALVDYMRSLQ